jgi:hypothetical protein
VSSKTNNTNKNKMNTTNINRTKATKVYAAAITAMLFGAGTGLVVYQNRVANLEVGMDEERIKNEGLFSEKLMLEKEIALMQSEYEALNMKTGEFESKWKKTLASLSDRDQKIKALASENDRAKKLKTELAALKTLKDQMQAELDKAKSQYASIDQENAQMKTEIFALRNKNEALLADVEILHQVAVNNALVEATKGRKEKLTVAAAKTQKVKVGFDLPEKMVGNLYFRMTTPDGKTVTSDQSTITVIETDIDGSLTASAEGAVVVSNKKHIEMEYKPEGKLNSGIYRIEVYSGDEYLGTTRVHLK